MLSRKFINKIYYKIRPAIPRNIQIWMRRWLIRRQRLHHINEWPILQSAAVVPAGWQGWPDNKRFAFIITHDVELSGGHDKCRQLSRIELELGFKSSFNFVPLRYKVSKELRDYLTSNGFEIGVQGLLHDGKLFQSRKIFDERAQKINEFLRDWDAVGFRSPSMHHNLEWMHDLSILYDSSTFDTDPFEPQADGVGTIFPFWVKNASVDRGYIELPYTLPQDFTLFILLKEKTIDIWKNKLDWIVENGGMALINVHPDYVNFNSSKQKGEEFPIELYVELLKYIKDKYSGQYWHSLPKEAAKFSKDFFCKKLNTVL
jgi:hypothetical protein